MTPPWEILVAPTWDLLGGPIIEADCVDALRAMPDASVDAIVCDPPYLEEAMNLDPPTGYWLAGLTDGEGCFRIQRNAARKSGPASWATTFAIKLRDDDRATLDVILAATGVGRIAADASRTGNSRPCASWIVDTLAGCRELVAIFDAYPLRSRKARDFSVWREAVDWWLTTPKGNRWHGSRDWSPMATFADRLRAARAYQEAPDRVA